MRSTVDDPGAGDGTCSDLVVVLPGVMGSSLVDRSGREVWGLRAGGLLRALRTLGGSIKKLALPRDVGDGPAEDGVRATSLIPGLHMIPGVWSPVEGYAGLTRFLRHPRFKLVQETDAVAGNLVLFPYDWRLSNRRNAKLLKRTIESALPRWRESRSDRAEAKVIFIAHSMGGLVTRWYVEQLGGREITRAAVTIGTPHRGALKALAQLVNGVDKGLGPLQIDFTAFTRSLPSVHELLPEYACIDTPGGLKKTTEVTVPHLNPEMVRAGMAFHEGLNSGDLDYDLIPIVGIGQPTFSAGRFAGERLESSRLLAGVEPGGDGTVPRVAARPFQMKERNPAIRGVGEGHGALAATKAVLDQLDLLLTAEETVYRLAAPKKDRTERGIVGVETADVHFPGEPVKVRVHADPQALEVAAVEDGSHTETKEIVRFGKQRDEEGRAIGEALLEGLAPGAYRLIGRAPEDPGGLRVTPVHAATLVCEGWA